MGLELEAAIALLLENAPCSERTESVFLLEALQRISAEQIVAPRNNPPFDRSPLDGYTFRAADTLAASQDTPAKFAIVGEVCAGECFREKVQPGQAVRIMTGGKIPGGCDCVIRQEDVQAEGGILFVPRRLRPHENYVLCGEDIKSGSVLLQPGDVITAAHIGVLASMGYEKIRVYARARVAICSTGDELVDVGQPLPDGKIYNSNLYTLTARLKELGVTPVMLGIAGDDAKQAAALIRGEMEQADLFLTTGGVSVGKKDILHEVIKELPAQRLFWRVNVKPGTPVLAYTFKGRLGIALSGNPFAALATFELLVRPVLAKISRRPQVNYERCTAVLQDDFLKASPGRRFVRAKYAAGQVHLPPANHSSGSMFSAAACNALLDIPAGSAALARGAAVDVVKL